MKKANKKHRVLRKCELGIKTKPMRSDGSKYRYRNGKPLSIFNP